MHKISYNPNKPIILGLAGQAATGKTSVAENIVPKAKIQQTASGMLWDHIFFALPLYEMVSIKKNIRGLRERDRQLYSLHSVVYELFGGSPISNVPDYEELISLVRNIYSLNLDENGSKPRSFLQKTGDLCRAIDPDCFANWATSKAKSLYKEYLKDINLDDSPLPFCVIISDVRFKNEAEAILSQENGILVCYEASDEVRNNRILDRDGVYMTEEQKNHKSEQEIEFIRDMANIIINTDELTVEEQTNITINYINQVTGIYA